MNEIWREIKKHLYIYILFVKNSMMAQMEYRFNFIGNLSAITTPIVIGFLATGDSFAPAITYISVLALIGALSYILLVGKVERIKL